MGRTPITMGTRIRVPMERTVEELVLHKAPILVRTIRIRVHQETERTHEQIRERIQRIVQVQQLDRVHPIAEVTIAQDPIIDQVVQIAQGPLLEVGRQGAIIVHQVEPLHAVQGVVEVTAQVDQVQEGDRP